MESALALIVLITVVFIVIGIASSGNRRYRRPGDYYNPYYDDYQAPPPVIMVQPAVPMPYGRGRDPIMTIVAILACMFLVYLLGRASAPEKVKIPERHYPQEGDTNTQYYDREPEQNEGIPVEYTSGSQVNDEPPPASQPAVQLPSGMGSVRSVLAITLRRYTSQENAEKLVTQYPQRGIEVLQYGENDFLACIIFGDDREAANETMTDLQRPHNRKDLARFDIIPELQIIHIQSFNPAITP